MKNIGNFTSAEVAEVTSIFSVGLPQNNPLNLLGKTPFAEVRKFPTICAATSASLALRGSLRRQQHIARRFELPEENRLGKAGTDIVSGRIGSVSPDLIAAHHSRPHVSMAR